MDQFREKIAKEYLSLLSRGRKSSVAILVLVTKYRVDRSTIYRNAAKLRRKMRLEKGSA